MAKATTTYRGACPICRTVIHFATTMPLTTTDTLSFTLNGRSVSLSGPDPAMSLNEYLRTIAGLKVSSRGAHW
jgi:hypothetical protein